MHLSVLTPSETLFSDDITSVTVPAVPGILTILPKHIHLTAQLTTGELKITQNSKETIFSIGEGFLSVTPTETTILISRGANLIDLDEKIILDAITAAQNSLKEKPTDMSTIALHRQAIFDLKLLRKRKKYI